MNKFFVVTKGEVKYPTWSPEGLYLKSVHGDIEYPVVGDLSKSMSCKIGQKVEENIDFEVIKREMATGRSDQKGAFLCDKGEIAGGMIKDEEWLTSIIGESKEYPTKSLKPVQVAESVKSKKYLEEIYWRKIEKDYYEVMDELHSPYQIVNWFRMKLKQ